MNNETFKAVVLTQDDRKTLSSVAEKSISDLPEGDVLVKVDYSTINYKDALAVTGKGRIIREFPFIPGIDLVGTVVESDGSFDAGSSVVLTGWGVGERHFGGLSQYARLKSKWLLPLPKGLSPKTAMAAGTAGLTAAMCVAKVIDGGVAKGSEVVVTGASGGVGSFAVYLLSKLGYQVAAISRPESSDYLTALGAHEVIDREDYKVDPKPLDKGRWAGGVDTVGTKALAKVLSECDNNAVIAACGLAGGMDLPTTVAPFILRGVTLAGVDSVYASLDIRQRAWQLLADNLDADAFETIGSQTIGLDGVAEHCANLLAGQHQGRVIVDVNA